MMLLEVHINYSLIIQENEEFVRKKGILGISDFYLFILILNSKCFYKLSSFTALCEFSQFSFLLGQHGVSGFPGHNTDAERLEDIGCSGTPGPDRAKLKLP